MLPPAHPSLSTRSSLPTHLSLPPRRHLDRRQALQANRLRRAEGGEGDRVVAQLRAQVQRARHCIHERDGEVAVLLLLRRQPLAVDDATRGGGGGVRRRQQRQQRGQAIEGALATQELER